MIELSDVTKTYGARQALTSVEFRVPAGTVTGFVGPNGAGKSTAMRIIAGLETPTNGQVLIDGQPMDGRPGGQFGVGALLDASWVHPRRRALDHLWAIAASHGVGLARARECLELTGLASVARQSVGTFSLGMRQRLGVAAALIARPRALLLDEPVNGLDPDGVAWVRHLLRDLAARGVAVLISSHLLSELAQTAERIVMIGAGRIVYEGSLAELLVSDAEDVLVSADDNEVLAAKCLAAGALVESRPDGRLRITGLTPVEVSRLANTAGVLLVHLSQSSATLEERFTTMTDDHQQYRASLLGASHE